MRAQDVPSVTVVQMREVDRLMIEQIGVTLEQMMENAGRALAELVRRTLLDVGGRRIVVLAGPGGNGGGALVAARRLAIWGANVSVALGARPAEMHAAPAHQLAIVGRVGIQIAGPEEAVPRLEGAALTLDGLFGYSLAGAPRGRPAELIRAANDSGAPIIALDVPSGLSSDTGEPFDPTIRATQTLTLALPEVGLLKPRARPYVGELWLADISVPAVVYQALGLTVDRLFASADIVAVSWT
jgi:NAD(P)H-hydrate epimerase